VTTTGEAFCWGNNTNGQLGDGTAGLEANPRPVAVAGSRSWATISTGSSHTCGVTTAGDAYCWGENDSGQLGNGNTTQQTVPGLVVNDIKWTRVSAGRLTTCGLTLAGAAYCWGANQYGQAGNGNAGGNQTAPVLVGGGFSWSAVDAGWEHNCGRTVNGQGYCWGRGIQGQLGAGSTEVTSTPVRISDPQ
jgi:alpha-tubulin suppressor-like RCC1 family protein